MAGMHRVAEDATSNGCWVVLASHCVGSNPVILWLLRVDGRTKVKAASLLECGKKLKYTSL